MTSSVGRDSLIMASGTAVSRLTGQIRTILLAAAVGTTGLAANAYQAGSMIPQVVFTLVSGGIFNAVLVPQIVRTLKKKNAENLLNRLITFAALLLLAVTLIMTVATPLLTRLYAGDGGTDMVALTSSFTLWCMPQIFFYGIYTVLGQILAAKNRFGAYAWSSVGANVISCVGFIIFIVVFGNASQQPLGFWTIWKIALTAGTWTLGVAAQALLLFIPLYKTGIRYRPSFGFRGIGLRSMGPVAAWSLAIVVVEQLATIINTRITNSAPSRAAHLFGLSQFSVAGNATYQNAYTIFILPYSLIAVSVATAMFPKISQAVAESNINEARKDLSRSLRNVNLLMCYFSAAFLAMPTSITMALLPSVSMDGVMLISQALSALAFALPLSAAYLIIQRTFYAFEDGLRPFIFILIQVSIQVSILLIGIIFVAPVHWVTLMCVSLTVSFLCSFPSLIWMIRKPFHNRIDGAHISGSYAKAFIAMAVAIMGGLLLRQPTYDVLRVRIGGSGRPMSWFQAVGVCIILVVVITALYLGVLWLLKSSELTSGVGTLRAYLSARKQGASMMAASAATKLRRVQSSRTTAKEPNELLDKPSLASPTHPSGQPLDSSVLGDVESPPAQISKGGKSGHIRSVSASPIAKLAIAPRPLAQTTFDGVTVTMEPQLGDVILNRYTLVSLLRSQPGLQAWKANDQVLARDCQMFIINDKRSLPQISNIASSLALSRNTHFTRVIQLLHIGGVAVLITQLDRGQPLSTYVNKNARSHLTYTAMRSIISSVAQAIRGGSDDILHQALSTDTVRIHEQGVELADAPISPLLTDMSHAEEPQSGSEQLATRQLAALLYAMLVGEPSNTDMEFDLDKLDVDIPSEFRVICRRGLDIHTDVDHSVAMATLDELRALLGPFTPLDKLSAQDLTKPSRSGEASIVFAGLKTIDKSRILPFPSELTKQEKPEGNSAPADTQSANRPSSQDQPRASTLSNGRFAGNKRTHPKQNSDQINFHDIAADEMANIFEQDDPNDTTSFFTDLGGQGEIHRSFDFTRGNASNSVGFIANSSAMMGIEGTAPTGRIPIFDDQGLPIAPVDKSARLLAQEDALEARNDSNAIPPSFTPADKASDAKGQGGNLSEDDIADTPLFGRLKTKVVTIILVVVIVLAALGFAVYGLVGKSVVHNPGHSSESLWPSMNNVPFGKERHPSRDDQSASDKSSTKKKNNDSDKADVSAKDRNVNGVPQPKVAENNTPLNMDKQVFLTNPAGQRGYAYYMHLSQPSDVYKFVVTIRSSGGHASLIVGSSDNPQGGKQVADFSFDASGTTNVKFNMQKGVQDFLLWVPQSSLPDNQLYINSVQFF